MSCTQSLIKALITVIESEPMTYPDFIPEELTDRGWRFATEHSTEDEYVFVHNCKLTFQIRKKSTTISYVRQGYMFPIGVGRNTVAEAVSAFCERLRLPTLTIRQLIRELSKE